MAFRNATAEWKGDLEGGSGSFAGASGKLGGDYSAGSRFGDSGGTNPEELVAAAHASCFSMALALVLGKNQTPPERLTVTAACTLDEVDGAPRITTVELTVRARVPGLDKAGLQRNVKEAADLCPVSNALRGNVAISVRDELDGG